MDGKVIKNVMGSKFNWDTVDEFFDSAKEIAFLFRWWLDNGDFKSFCMKMIQDRFIPEKQEKAFEILLADKSILRQMTTEKLKKHTYWNFVQVQDDDEKLTSTIKKRVAK